MTDVFFSAEKDKQMTDWDKELERIMVCIAIKRLIERAKKYKAVYKRHRLTLERMLGIIRAKRS